MQAVVVGMQTMASSCLSSILEVGAYFYTQLYNLTSVVLNIFSISGKILIHSL